MSRRIDIELTSALDDGTWTWRAAGAKQPKGVLDGGVLPDGAKVGDELKVEVEQQLDGITVLSVVHARDKQQRSDLLELLPSETDFKPVVETRAKGGRGDRRDRRDRGDRRDDRGGRRDRNRRGGSDGREDRDGDRRPGRDRGRRGPSFTPPPEVPQRPKPKRLKPGKAHRSAVLDDLPEEQRAIAELALQGMPAVRQRLKEENERAVAEGRPTMPEASVLKLAEELLPRLRVAEWLDRAEAAQRQVEHLDLRDLRSVVAAAGDPVVARDESTRPLAEELQAALATKQEQELQLWFGDVDAALAVGRVVRALRLSSQPPKAGVPFPADIARRLVDSTNASLAPMDSSDRWIAMLEAAAFSPVRSQVRPARKPDAVSDELMATVKRLAPALPQVAELFEVDVDPDAPMPKPLRPGPARKSKAPKKKAAAKQPAGRRDNGPDDDATGQGQRKRKRKGEGAGKPDAATQAAGTPDAAPDAEAQTEPAAEAATEATNESEAATESQPATQTESAADTVAATPDAPSAAPTDADTGVQPDAGTQDPPDAASVDDAPAESDSA